MNGNHHGIHYLWEHHHPASLLPPPTKKIEEVHQDHTITNSLDCLSLSLVFVKPKKLTMVLVGWLVSFNGIEVDGNNNAFGSRFVIFFVCSSHGAGLAFLMGCDSSCCQEWCGFGLMAIFWRDQ
jgi:hypothetical protein